MQIRNNKFNHFLQYLVPCISRIFSDITKVNNNLNHFYRSFCESSSTTMGGNNDCAYDNNLVKAKVSETCNDKSKCFIQ